jgi:alginate O-acetyltransferase complex protein AlgI
VVFSSGLFLFLFLPVFLAVYYLAPERARSLIILLGSYAFYGWWRWDFLILFAAVKVWVYVASLGIAKAREKGDEAGASRATTVGVVGALAALAWFKYAGFGVDNLNLLLASLGFGPLGIGKIILPIGISFYVFQAVSYVIDVHRGDAKPARSVLDFAAFIALFPQLVAGPVLRYKDVADQFEHRETRRADLAIGATRFMGGFCKKVLVADAVAPLANAVFDLPGLGQPGGPTLSLSDAALGTAAYTVQLYFDFSGYSDMAIGLGRLMGFHFLENFDHPYMSKNITEFWRRWHISLSSWLRDYLYIPLGGNRYGTARTYLNLWLTMVLGGLWHGASWSFVLWGVWHGSILALERRLGERAGGKAPQWGALPTLALVMVGWILFRAVDLSTAWAIITAFSGRGGLGLSPEVGWSLHGWSLFVLALSGPLIYGSAAWRRAWSGAAGPARLRLERYQLAFVPAFVLAVLRLSAQSYTPFLYFQF